MAFFRQSRKAFIKRQKGIQACATRRNYRRNSPPCLECSSSSNWFSKFLPTGSENLNDDPGLPGGDSHSQLQRQANYF
jgi:hypothetical protein